MLYARGSDDVAAGQLLLGELNCTSCHQADASLAAVDPAQAGPGARHVGSASSRSICSSSWPIRRRPSRARRCPTCWPAFREAERGPIVEALVHFLATTGSVTHANPMRQPSIAARCCFTRRLRRLPRSAQGAEPPAAGHVDPAGHAVAQVHAARPDAVPAGPAGRAPRRAHAAPESDAGRGPRHRLVPAERPRHRLGPAIRLLRRPWDKLPDFSKLTPMAVGDADELRPERRQAQGQFRPAVRRHDQARQGRRLPVPDRLRRRLAAADRRQARRRQRRRASVRAETQDA